MLNILIKTDSHYKVNRDRIRNVIGNNLNTRGVKGRAEVSIAIVGDRQMKYLNKKYRNIDSTSSILTFPQGTEDYEKGPFIDPPDNVLRLGDIVVSYPQVVTLASEEDKLVDDKIDELIEHGLSDLLG